MTSTMSLELVDSARLHVVDADEDVGRLHGATGQQDVETAHRRLPPGALERRPADQHVGETGLRACRQAGRHGGMRHVPFDDERAESLLGELLSEARA